MTRAASGTFLIPLFFGSLCLIWCSVIMLLDAYSNQQSLGLVKAKNATYVLNTTLGGVGVLCSLFFSWRMYTQKMFYF